MSLIRTCIWPERCFCESGYDLRNSSAFRGGPIFIDLLGRPQSKSLVVSRYLRALRADVKRIKRLAGGHEQAVFLCATKTEVGAGFR